MTSKHAVEGTCPEGYVSEFEQFMQGYLQQHPEVIDDQREGWNIFWDKRVDLDALRVAEQDRVPQRPYVYQ
jgi:hypothetical protein